MKSDLVDIAGVKHAVQLHKGDDMGIINAGDERTVCKIGQCAECCIFLVGGSRGLECAKFSGLADALLRRKAAGSMVASRVGNCQLSSEEDWS